ncbi:MAG: phage portal protein [Defluviitaleaceae bacterium]|nr:phage portal protein [Defluviitaleaceae bacterium]
MKIISNLFNTLKSGIKGNPGGDFSFLFGGSAAGKFVNESTAMQTSAVYACVRILAEAIASLPLHVYERGTYGGKTLSINHPLYRLLHDEPNPEMTSFVFRETLMSHLLIWGNAYAQIVRDGHGRPAALYPLLPDRTMVERNERGHLVYIYKTDSGEVVKLPREQVLHIPGLGFDGLAGYSPIAMAKSAIGMALAAEEYGAMFFGNGANPSGTLEHPNTIKDIDHVRESWNARFQGTGKAHGIAILEEGMKFNPISIPPEQAQFLQTRKFQIAEIARIFRVPPHMIGDLEKASFNNIEHQSLEFVKYTLDPWLARWESSMKKDLMLPGEKSRMLIRFDVYGLLRGDYVGRMRGYAIGRQNGFLSVNDICDMEDRNRIPAKEGGDLYMVNGNMKTLASLMRREEDT